MEGDLQRIVGQNLRTYREGQGLSQEAFADLLGVHRTYMGGVERGERNLTLKSLERLAQRIEVDPMTLLTPGAGAGANEDVRRAEKELLELATMFDEPVARSGYLLTLLSLGHRSRTLFLGFLQLQVGPVPVAARALVRPLVEINILVRFLRKNPDLHTELWQAEGDRNSIAMSEEVTKSAELLAQLGEAPLEAGEIEARKKVVSAARQQALDAGVPGIKKTGALLPSIPDQLKLISELAANGAYTFLYRAFSWEVHAGPRAFLIGTYTSTNDGRVFYEEQPLPGERLPVHVVAIATLASTIELIAAEFGLPAEASARAIRRTFVPTAVS